MWQQGHLSSCKKLKSAKTKNIEAVKAVKHGSQNVNDEPVLVPASRQECAHSKQVLLQDTIKICQCPHTKHQLAWSSHLTRIIIESHSVFTKGKSSHQGIHLRTTGQTRAVT